MVLVSVDPALALFHVDWIARQVPVNDAVAIGVKVQTFLPDRRGRKHERPKGRIERRAHKTCPVYACFILALLGKAHSEAAAQGDGVRLHDAAALHSIFVQLDLGRSQRQRFGYTFGHDAHGRSGRMTNLSFGLEQNMDVLIQYGLKVVFGPVAQGRPLVNIAFGAQQRLSFWLVKERPKRHADMRGGRKKGGMIQLQTGCNARQCAQVAGLPSATSTRWAKTFSASVWPIG